MSKELPYYQFEVAEYLAGDIMCCSLEAQGLFAVIKSIYWQRECKLTLDKVLRRYNKPKLINELKEERAIKIDDLGNIEITFLKKQFNELKKKKKKLSDAGRKGGLKKSQATLKPPLSDAKATPKHKEEKRREEKKGEKEVYKSHKHLFIYLYEFQKLVDVYGRANSDEYVDKVCNYAKNTNYTSLYLTALAWLKKDYGSNGTGLPVSLPPLDKIVAIAATVSTAQMESLIKKGYTKEDIEKTAKN